MYRNILCFLLLVALIGDSPMARAQNQKGKWQLVFSDEFNRPDGSQPNSKKWSHAPRANNGWARWISNSAKVAFIKKGKLICRAIPNKSEESDSARMLTSAFETKNKFSFQYGKVEVRMRTNLKRGNFPAVWMVPDYTSDKRYGEIDIVEMFGNEKSAAHTAHTHRSYSLKKEGIQRTFKEKLDITKWHVYGVIWTEESIVWTVDGETVGEYKKINTPEMQREGQWTFDRPFYLRLNQSVGNGNHPLLIPNYKATYETQFDWIRVYQMK